MKNKNESGFTLIESLVITVVIAVICFLGWSVDSKHNTKISKNTLSSSTSTEALGYNCSSTKSVSLVENSLSLQMPSCWKVNTYGSTDTIRIDSSNNYAAACPLPSTTKGPCYPSDAYIYINAGLPASLKGLQGYTPTTFQGQQAYCTTPNESQSKALPSNIPSSIPKGILLGAGCYILVGNNYFDIYVIQNSQFSDINQVSTLLGSIKFK
ncbi:MAG TPA: hypothetical protein VFN51_00500 [Candidatus Saccharimonadales bacterium]|nr:hypothetical protein [Candidatus Saccharimonadales bacterium]